MFSIKMFQHINGFEVSIKIVNFVGQRRRMRHIRSSASNPVNLSNITESERHIHTERH